MRVAEFRADLSISTHSRRPGNMRKPSEFTKAVFHKALTTMPFGDKRDMSGSMSRQ
jgi:hypothetical protein